MLAMRVAVAPEPRESMVSDVNQPTLELLGGVWCV